MLVALSDKNWPGHMQILQSILVAIALVEEKVQVQCRLRTTRI